MVASDPEKIILIFHLNIKATSSKSFVSCFGQTGLTVRIESVLSDLKTLKPNQITLFK